MIDRYRHEALIYGSDDELLEVVVPFLRGGLSAGEPSLVCLPPGAQALVVDGLGAVDGVTLLEHRAAATPLSMLRGWHALVSDLSAASPHGVRAVGGVPDGAWPAWARYEAAVNRVVGPLPVWGICPYDTRKVTADVLADVERTHPRYATPDLAGVRSDAFEDPATFLERRERQPDAVESAPPDVELTDPSPGVAGRVVEDLADAARLDNVACDSIRLGVGAVVANAQLHGRGRVLVRAWAPPERVVVTITDAGDGPADRLAGVIQTGPSADESSSLYHVREAVSDVAMFREPEGFTVRLVQRAG